MNKDERNCLKKRQGPLALIILDGFGYRAEREGNAIALARMPYYHELLEKYPHTLIEASGECVGLPAGVMGNSNVGHHCMGAGRIVLTDIERINHAIKSGEFFHNHRHALLLVGITTCRQADEVR